MFSYTVTFLAILLLYFALEDGANLPQTPFFFGCMIALIGIGSLLSLTVMIINFFSKDKDLPTYKQRLEVYLQSYFDEINAAIFRRRGIIWKIGNRMKWIELIVIRIGQGRMGGVNNAAGSISVSAFNIQSTPKTPTESDRKLIESSSPKKEELYGGGSEVVMPPQPESEKNVIKKITNKLKENFWKYYKEKKLEMIEEEEVDSQDNVSFFKDEHGGFEESSQGSFNESPRGSISDD